MDILEIDNKELEIVESILLAKGCHFANDAKNVIRCWESVDVAACPGSGKTTVLLAKLKLLADRMPFQNGSGVCVLSHTNVAVNEIKTKLSDYADILMSYPNYVGTIQSFIDQFVTKPYLKQKTDIGIQVVENSVYAQHLYKLLWKDKSKNSPYQKLRYFIKYNVKNGSGQYDNEVSYMENLYQKNGALYVSKQKKPLAGADAPSAKQYEAAVQELLTLEGLIRHNDAYQYAVESVRELSTEYTDLFCRRFQYVFIDEYQDCNQMQRDALDKLFNQNKCCVFHIGDSDQAIYNSDNSEIEDWKPSASCLSMVSSNRYGQEIADVLTNLRTDKKVINASSGKTGYIPTVIIFDDASIDVEGNHEAIIPSETWELVQEEMERRRNMDARYSSASIFSSKIKCSECGNWYGSKVWHSQDKYRRVIFQCNRKFKNDKKCRTPHLTEDEIKDAFVKAVNAVIPEKDELIANTKVMMRTLCDTTELEVEQSRFLTETKMVAEMVKKIVAENQTTAADQREYQMRRNELVARYESAKDGHEKASEEIADRQRKRKVYMRSIGGLQKLDGFCKGFDEELWTALLDHATVYTKDDIRFTFKVGNEVKVDG